jgi:hypothetical protein
MRVELMVEVLQTSALPLGYRAGFEGSLKEYRVPPPQVNYGMIGSSK